MLKTPKHLFLKLYQGDVTTGEKPLSYYINDYDKEIPVKIYHDNNISKPINKYFRNLDEIFLFVNSTSNHLFVLNYLIYLQAKGVKVDISIQDIFELSIVKDSTLHDEHRSKAFKYAYITDSRRNEIQIYQQFFMLNMWADLGITDLEFRRRVLDSLVNSTPSFKHFKPLKWGDHTFKSPFIDQKNSHNTFTFPNNDAIMHGDYRKELCDLEKKLLEDIDAPENIFFDGHRFTIIIKDSPVSLMFDIEDSKTYNIGGRTMRNKAKMSKSNHNRYTGGINIKHPTKLQPAFVNKEASERNNSWWNGRTSWDYTWRGFIDTMLEEVKSGKDLEESIKNLELISFILLLKNGGKVKKSGNDISKIFSDYRTKRDEVKTKYHSVIVSQSSLAKELYFDSNREISFIHESANGGYIVSFYKRYIKHPTKKVSSRAIFYDKDFKVVGKSSSYKDYIPTTHRIRTIRGKDKKNDAGVSKYISDLTFEKITRDCNVLSIDYVGSNVSDQLRELDLLAIRNDDTHSLHHMVYIPEFFKYRLSEMYKINSIKSYADQLMTQVSKYGFANVNDYDGATDILNGDNLVTDYIDSSEYVINDVGATSGFIKERRVVIFRDKRTNKMIDTEYYSSLEKHVPFEGVKYEVNDIEALIRYNIRNGTHDDMMRTVTPKENYIRDKELEDSRPVYVEAKNKRN